MLYLDELANSIKRIQEKDVRLCVVGVGTIGLPLATFLANVGFQVTGLDINQKRVDEINSAKVIYEYTDILEDVVLKSQRSSKFEISISLFAFLHLLTPKKRWIFQIYLMQLIE